MESSKTACFVQCIALNKTCCSLGNKMLVACYFKPVASNSCKGSDSLVLGCKEILLFPSQNILLETFTQFHLHTFLIMNCL